MSKNYTKNNYQNKKDFEEHIQISHESCNSEEEIPEAIERSKRKLKSTEAPHGYSKIDEKITTKVYQVPHNEYINENNIIKEETGYDNENYQYDPNYEEYDNEYQQEEYEENNNYNNNIYNTDYKKSKVQTSNNYYNSNDNYYNTDYYDRNKNFKLEYVNSVNPVNMKYVEDYEKNYNYNNRTAKTFTKYIPIKMGRIENYYENNISKDGQYLVTVSISKIVNDPVPIIYDDKSTEINNKAYNNYNYKKEKIEITKNIETPRKEVNKTNNCNNYNYRKEKKEIVKSTETPKKVIIQSNNQIKNTEIKDKFGHNYNFYERKENSSSSKKSETHQRMRQPIQVQKNIKYASNQNNSSYNSNQTGKEVKTVIKSYKKEVIGSNDNKNLNKITTNTTTKQINVNSNYKRSGKH